MVGNTIMIITGIIAIVVEGKCFCKSGAALLEHFKKYRDI